MKWVADFNLLDVLVLLNLEVHSVLSKYATASGGLNIRT